jgi:uncharacterized protein YggE
MKVIIKERLSMKTKNLFKSKLSFIFTLAVACVLSFSFSASKVLAADSSVANTDAARTINVAGTGEITVTPDIAYLYLGVVTDKPTTIEAQNANSIAMNKVIAAIKNEGILDEDIKTNDYSISPKYDYDKNTGTSTLVGYTVSNTLKVTIKDITKVGRVLDKAVESGANIANRISFGISDYEKYYNMALQKALSNAQGKAQTISSFFGLKLSMPVKIIENSYGLPYEYPIAFTTKEAFSDSMVSTSIQSGVYKVKADISLVYEY